MKTGARVVGPTLRACSLPAPAEQPDGLLGIGIAKALGSHCRRNLAKRRIREASRIARVGARVELDMVLLGGAKALEAPWTDLVAECTHLLQKSRERWQLESESP